MTPITVRLLRKIVSGSNYYEHRVSRMEGECTFFLDQARHASNNILRVAFIKTAAMYYKRHSYYLNKISNDELRKNIQGGAREAWQVAPRDGEDAGNDGIGALED